jgi:hypothetical protein
MAWACAVAVVVAGCGAAGSPAALPPSRDSEVPVRSWMSPLAKHQDLLYVSLADPNEHVVLVYAYRTATLLGTITGFKYPQALCLNQKGDLYVSDDARHQIFELHRGETTPFKVLVDPLGRPLGCAVDPTTGDLAVANFTGNTKGGNLAIFHHDRGIPIMYVTDAIYYYFFPAYDQHGNLFVDGENESVSLASLAELPAGGKKLISLTVDQAIEYPGGMYWDGQYLAVGDQDARAVYEFSISGSSATLENTTSVQSAQDLFEFWISPTDKTLVGANYGSGHCQGSQVYYWRYPEGGTPLRSFEGVPCASGVVVSPAR